MDDLNHFRRLWQAHAQAHSTIRVRTLRMDNGVFIDLLQAICDTVSPETEARYFSAFQTCEYWRLNIFDVYGLFGQSGCIETFLHPVLFALPVVCATAEEAVELLKHAQQTRLARDRHPTAEWIPEDARVAIDIARCRGEGEEMINQPTSIPSLTWPSSDSHITDAQL